MVTLKTVMGLVISAVVLSSALTYVVTRVSLSVTCETPVQTTAPPTQPIPHIPTDNGKRY